MKKDKELLEKLKKIDLVFLATHLGFTPVSKSSKYYTLEEHDSFMIKLQEIPFNGIQEEIMEMPFRCVCI